VSDALAGLSIIIVNYNTASLLRDCLNSLYRNEGKACELIVVDNGSIDGSAEVVAREFPSVRLIRNDDNPGFAKANNQGLKAATGTYLLLLNSDTVVRPGALDAMATFLDATPEAGAVACKLLNQDGTVQASVHERPGPVLLLFRLLGVSRLVRGDMARRWFGRVFGVVLGKTVGAYFIPYATGGDAIEVQGLSGACLMLRSEAVAQIGLLDERFFMYLEDLDYCLRLRQAGWKLYYVRSGEIVHLVGASSGNRMRNYSAQSYRSLFHFYRKHFSRPMVEMARVMVLIAIGTRWAWYWTGSKLSNGATYRQNASDLEQILRTCLDEVR
jgi:GT2 family glycosyltransferase